MNDETNAAASAMERLALPTLTCLLLVGATMGQQHPEPKRSAARIANATEEALVTATAAADERVANGGEDDPIVPIHTAQPDMGVDYGIWGGGPGYKVSFHDGASFVPMLGKSYPHNQPWRWSTTSVQLGGHELVTHAPRLQYGDRQARFDLGGVIETYELRHDGVEQTFVIERRAAPGDLVVHGVVDSMLQAQPAAAAHQQLRFTDAAGAHLFTYGAAVAIDANGRRGEMTTAYEHGEITLRLDGGWLDGAAFPIVVDPLMGPGTQVFGGERDTIDSVRDRTNTGGEVWVAYSVWASAVDRDVYVRRFGEDGVVGPIAFPDMTTQWSSQNPRVSYAGATLTTMTVFDRLFPVSGNRWIRYHVHDVWDLATNTSFGVITTGDSAWRPDVGGQFDSNGSDDCLVVWQQEPNGGPFAPTSNSSIYGCLVSTAGGLAGTPFVIASDAPKDIERPDVNRMSRGWPDSTWLVAYQVRHVPTIGGIGDWDIEVVEIDQAGAVSAPTGIDAGSPDHQMAPFVEGRSGIYLVGFTASPNAGPPLPTEGHGHELRVARLNWAEGGGVGTEPFGTQVLLANAQPRWQLGGIAFHRATKSHWALQIRSVVSEFLYLRTVGYRGMLLQEETVLPAWSGTSVVGGICFEGTGPGPYQVILPYALNDGSNTMTIDRFQWPIAPPTFATGTSCSPATIQWSGPRLIGSSAERLSVDGAANDSIHLALAGTAPISAQLFGVPPLKDGCWLFVPPAGADHLGVFPIQVGSSAEWRLPLPETLPSMTLYFQGVHSVGNGSLDFVTTQARVVPITR